MEVRRCRTTFRREHLAFLFCYASRVHICLLQTRYTIVQVFSQTDKRSLLCLSTHRLSQIWRPWSLGWTCAFGTSARLKPRETFRRGGRGYVNYMNSKVTQVVQRRSVESNHFGTNMVDPPIRRQQDEEGRGVAQTRANLIPGNVRVWPPTLPAAAVRLHGPRYCNYELC